MSPDMWAHSQHSRYVLHVFEQFDLHGNRTAMTGMRTVALDGSVHLFSWRKMYAPCQHLSDPSPLNLYNRESRPSHIEEGILSCSATIVTFPGMLISQ